MSSRYHQKRRQPDRRRSKSYQRQRYKYKQNDKKLKHYQRSKHDQKHFAKQNRDFRQYKQTHVSIDWRRKSQKSKHLGRNERSQSSSSSSSSSSSYSSNDSVSKSNDKRRYHRQQQRKHQRKYSRQKNYQKFRQDSRSRSPRKKPYRDRQQYHQKPNYSFHKQVRQKYQHTNSSHNSYNTEEKNIQGKPNKNEYSIKVNQNKNYMDTQPKSQFLKNKKTNNENTKNQQEQDAHRIQQQKSSIQIQIIKRDQMSQEKSGKEKMINASQNLIPIKSLDQQSYQPSNIQLDQSKQKICKTAELIKQAKQNLQISPIVPNFLVLQSFRSMKKFNVQTLDYALLSWIQKDFQFNLQKQKKKIFASQIQIKQQRQNARFLLPLPSLDQELSLRNQLDTLKVSLMNLNHLFRQLHVID